MLKIYSVDNILQYIYVHSKIRKSNIIKYIMLSSRGQLPNYYKIIIHGYMVENNAKQKS